MPTAPCLTALVGAAAVSGKAPEPRRTGAACSSKDSSFDRPVGRTAAEAIAERLRVLGQPLRVRLVDLLEREGEMAVGALAEALGESVHNVSQHLAVLRSAAVVSRRHRGREVWYRLSSPPAPLSIYERFAVALREEAERLRRAVERPE
ncbi:MAG: ArsR/SmtB family transcription factor [Thermoleophilaceae bacterium]